jgi:hypothetical protein
MEAIYGVYNSFYFSYETLISLNYVRSQSAADFLSSCSSSKLLWSERNQRSGVNKVSTFCVTCGVCGHEVVTIGSYPVERLFTLQPHGGFIF